jgi:AraC-like DNA-binding protein
VKARSARNQSQLWRSQRLFGIDFAGYILYNHSFPRHFHDHYVIEMVISGQDNFYCDGKDYTASDNELVLINPGDVHTGCTSGDHLLHYFSICPDQAAIQKIASTMELDLPVDFRLSSAMIKKPALSAQFRELYRSFYEPHAGLKQEELFFGCMHGLLELSLKKKNVFQANVRKDPRIDVLSDYVQAHSNEDISLQDMADLVNLNPFHLVRMFKKVMGISPYEYLLVKRTEKAKELLRKGYSVGEAALEAGFYDSSHLHRLLRKFAAIPPKAFLSSKGQYHTIFSA